MFDFMKMIALQVTFECQRDGRLPPYLGSTIRGIFGHSMRDLCCLELDRRKSCHDCKRRERCLYSLGFCSTGGEAGAVNPFVLYVPEQGREKWEKGDRCFFEMRIFGKNTEQAVWYLRALQAMEQCGWGAGKLPFKLLQIAELNQKKLIYANGKVWPENLSLSSMQANEREAGYAMLFFDTPLRLVSGRKLFETLPFAMLLEFIMRRMSLMVQKYTEYQMEWELNLLKDAKKVRLVEEEWKDVPFVRFSMTQKSGRVEMPANKGWVAYEGDLTPFTPILEAGRQIQVGKGTTVGFGHYEIFYN